MIYSSLIDWSNPHGLFKGSKLSEPLNKPCIALSCECRDCIATHAGNWIRMPSLFFKRARVVNPPYVVTCLSSKPVCPSHGLVMFHNIGTAAPFRATMQKQGVELSPYQIRNKDSPYC